MIGLSFLGGVGEIGGSIVLLEDQATRIFLDCGISLSEINKYYSEYLQMRKFSSIGDLLNFKIIPDMEGVYRLDYLKHMKREKEKRSIDACFLTHAHLDHCGLMPFLRHDIEFWMSKPTKDILYTLQETVANPFYEFLYQQYSFQKDFKTSGKGYKRLVGEEVKIDRSDFIKNFEPNKKFRIKDLEIEAFDVDHSMPCSAFIVYTSSGPIVYIGDIRHGEATQSFIEAAAKISPLVMICEGTRVSEENVGSEEDVFSRAIDVVNKTEGVVLVNYGVRNLPRIKTFYEVAKSSGRKLVIDARQAFLLDQFKGELGLPKTNYKNIGIYLSKKGWGLIDREDWPEELIEQDYFVWERKYINHKKRVSLEELRKNPDAFIVFIDFFGLNDLIDIKPPKGSSYIKSSTRPFNESMKLEEERLMRWLEWFGVHSTHVIHASGHMGYTQTKDMINTIKPELLIPTHTEHKEVFWGMYDASKVRMVEKGERVLLEGYGM